MYHLLKIFLLSVVVSFLTVGCGTLDKSNATSTFVQSDLGFAFALAPDFVEVKDPAYHRTLGSTDSFIIFTRLGDNPSLDTASPYPIMMNCIAVGIAPNFCETQAETEQTLDQQLRQMIKPEWNVKIEKANIDSCPITAWGLQLNLPNPNDPKKRTSFYSFRAYKITQTHTLYVVAMVKEELQGIYQSAYQQAIATVHKIEK